jgi:hypothetical protein
MHEAQEVLTLEHTLIYCVKRKKTRMNSCTNNFQRLWDRNMHAVLPLKLSHIFRSFLTDTICIDHSSYIYLTLPVYLNWFGIYQESYCNHCIPGLQMQPWIKFLSKLIS